MCDSYRLIQDGYAVAWSNSFSEIMHYAAVYSQDGPVAIQVRNEKGRWVKYKPEENSDER